MKLVLGLSVLSIAAMPAKSDAQVLCALGTAATPYESIADMPASPAAQTDLKRMKAVLCAKNCGKIFLFANATSPNAVTVTDGSGASKISYSPKFLGAVQEKYGPAASLGIFAHELGHHLDATNNHPAWMKASWDGELRADAWAGCALAKAELKPSAIQAAVRALSTYPVSGHADWNARVPAIRAGYASCGGTRTMPGALEEASDQEVAGKDERRADRRGDRRGDRDRDRDRDDDGRTIATGTGGCTSDQDCRNGRTCSNGHCGIATGPKRCGKDTDCPDPQECNAAGRCEGALPELRASASRESGSGGPPERTTADTATGANASSANATSKDPPESGKEVAMNEPLSKSSARGDAPACAKSCDEGRTRCIETAVSEQNQCVTKVQSDASYKACSCPNYPEGNYGCYRLCSGAYEQAKTCSSPDKVRDCKLEAERCRTHCR